MSRGEFLGAAGAASLGVTLGTPGDESQQTPCRPRCPPSRPRWSMPAGIFNIFWNDMYPRLVAATWLNQLGGTGGAGPLVPNMDTSDLKSAVQALQPAATSYIANPPIPTTWEARRSELLRFWGGDDASPVPANRMPMRVMGRGGYDFLLSDKGVDLFVPELPPGDTALLRLYTFRNAGRPTIGVPFYLASEISAVSTDSPTGPTDIIVDQAAILTQVPTSSNCPEVDCFNEQLGALLEDQDPAFPRQDQEFRVTWEKYRCMLADFRCWQIEGALYRGLMAETPRIVATTWFEKASGFSNSAESYAYRITVMKELREVFSERMETHIPGVDRMVFEQGSAPPQSNLVWLPRDVMITNQGLHFPSFDLPTAMMGPPDTRLKAMLTEIAEGRAGNPVFTDSKRTWV